MKKETVIKAFSIFLIVVVVTNLTLFVMKQINQSLFWTIIIVAALVAYQVVPRINKR